MGSMDRVVGRADIHRVMEAKATETGCCGVCGADITFTIAELADRECSQCGTQYRITGRTDDGDPEYELVRDSTPTERIRKSLRQTVHTAAVAQELTADKLDDDPEPDNKA